MTLAVKIGDEKSPVRGLMYFDAVTNFSESRQGSVTSFPLDAGVAISDHFIAKNPTFEVKGFLSAIDVSGMSSTITIDGDKPINAKEQQASPQIVDFSLGITKLLPGSIGQFFKTSIPKVNIDGKLTPTEDKVKEVLRELMVGVYYNTATKRYQNKMVPITLYELVANRIKIAHTDLVLTGFSIDEDADTGINSIPLTMTFERVRFVKVEKVDEGKKSSTASKKSTQKTANKGVKSVSPKDCVVANSKDLASAAKSTAGKVKSVVLVKDPKPFGDIFGGK